MIWDGAAPPSSMTGAIREVCAGVALLPARLVDQLTLITFPVMLGRGKRWYSGDPATARSWTLVEQTHSPKGVHFASFASDVEVRTGSFATKPPSEDELALRQRQAEGRW
jgi:hypothetical protein